MTRPSSIEVLVPFWGLAGGVIKILDYADHAAQLGISTTLWAPPLPTNPANPMSSLPVFRRLVNHNAVSIRALDDLVVGPEATVLFTEPTHHQLIELAAPGSLGNRLIHLVQGTRHGNPEWNDGLNYRLLHRPMTRITVSHEVTDVVGPLVNTRHQIHTIVEGHDHSYFAGRPETPTRDDTKHRMRVLYTTWKSDLGDRVAHAATEAGDDFAFVAVRSAVSWPTLRNRYHGADTLLCTPGPEEGFYLPGLEAMAANVAVVTALVGGNAAYIRPNENALVAAYDDVDAHLDALRVLRDDADLRQRLLAGGTNTLASHELGRERSEFGDVLASIGT